jgi:hypothetical protein
MKQKSYITERNNMNVINIDIYNLKFDNHINKEDIVVLQINNNDN